MELRHYILDDNNVCVAVDLLTWARWLEENNSKRIVAQTYFAGDVMVSTVFIGLDHSFFRHGPRELFETMIFGGPHDGYQERYATWDQAVVGHTKAVNLVEQGVEKC